jgi:hypothetical protein
MRPRTLQKGLGVSSVGLCAAQAQFMLQGVPETDAPSGRQAFMGSAIHDAIAKARAAYNAKLLIERELDLLMPSGVVLRGHADEIDRDEPSVTDLKTLVAGADMVALRRNGATEQQRYQRHLYYYGAMQAGLVPAQGIVRNVWLDRSGQDPEPFVEQEPFDMAVVEQADAWLSDVAYAAEHNEEPLREKHYDWCKRFCRYFSHCRADEMDAELVITDPEIITAAETAFVGRKMEKDGKALLESGRRVLSVLEPDPGGDVAAYIAGGVRVRYSWVNRQSGGSFTLHLDPV